MVSLPGVHFGGPEQLLQQQDARQLVGKGHPAHAHALVGAPEHVLVQAQRAANQKNKVAFALRKQIAQLLRKLCALILPGVDAHGDYIIVLADFLQNSFDDSSSRKDSSPRRL